MSIYISLMDFHLFMTDKFNWQSLTILEFFNPSRQLQSLSPSSREEVKINVHLLLLLLFFQEQTVHQIFNFSIDRQFGLSPLHFSIHLNNGWSAPTQG